MRLIDADALINYVKSLGTSPLNEWETWGVLAAIEKQPPIDAVPVVRCKDCEYGEQADKSSYICNNGAWVHLFCWEDDFCSRGIRREK